METENQRLKYAVDEHAKRLNDAIDARDKEVTEKEEKYEQLAERFPVGTHYCKPWLHLKTHWILVYMVKRYALGVCQTKKR